MTSVAENPMFMAISVAAITLKTEAHPFKPQAAQSRDLAWPQRTVRWEMAVP